TDASLDVGPSHQTAFSPQEGLDRERLGVDLQRTVLAQKPLVLVTVGSGQSPVRSLVQQMTPEEAASSLASRRADVARRRHRELERGDADARHSRNGAGRELDPREASLSVGRAQPSSMSRAAPTFAERPPVNGILRRE